MNDKQITVQDICIGEIITERVRQDEKWGQQNHNQAVWHLIDNEEEGEVAEAILKLEEAKARGDIAGILEWKDKLREEMIQHAAVALSRLECAFRKGDINLPEGFNWNNVKA